MDNVSPESSQQQYQSSGTLASAPPPPPEVKIRTMKSDLESMAKSGGGLPTFQNVKVAGLSVTKIKPEKPKPVMKVVPVKKNPGEHTNVGMIIAIIVLTVIILGVAGYFVHQFYTK